MADLFQRHQTVELALAEGQAALDALRSDCPAPRLETIYKVAMKLRFVSIELNKLAATANQPPVAQHAL